MSHSVLFSKSSRSLDDSVSVTAVVEYNGSSSRISSSNPRSDPASASCSTNDSPSNHLHFQQSLLTLIHLHFLRQFLESSLEWITTQPDHDLLSLKEEFPTFFKKVGYVSHNFFESALLATKVFFQTNTFNVVTEDLLHLCSFASFFGAEVQSVFLHVDGTFKVEEFLSYSPIISGLELFLENHNDLEFLNKSSLFFPHLKQLDVGVYGALSMSFIELLKVNSTVTNVNLKGNSIEAEGAKSLAEALKVNMAVTSIDLSWNFIGVEGARAVAEILKVNTTVSSFKLSGNSIGYEGAGALAEALIVNSTITSIDLSANSIGDGGAGALAEALKVNTTITNIDLMRNSIGDEGARILADVLKVNSTISRVNLNFNHIEDEGVRALEEAFKVNRVVQIEY
ncbi:hypothetical protein GEMRC1_009456 [Eukaryota sp. GEM-RC1]